jgi:hypothetical protein
MGVTHGLGLQQQSCISLINIGATTVPGILRLAPETTCRNKQMAMVDVLMTCDVSVANCFGKGNRSDTLSVANIYLESSTR